MKKLFIIFIFLILLIFVVYTQRDRFYTFTFRPTAPSGQSSQNLENILNTNITEGTEPEPVLKKDIEVVVENLKIPWEIAWLPTGEMLVTERPGNLLKVSADRKVIPIAGVEHRGEGGLLGLALHPDFGDNKFIYLYLTSRSGNFLINKVERYVLDQDKLLDKLVIIDNIPGSQYHDGGRIKFGPDSKLYISTGDASQSALAQNKNSLAGKILRINDDGSIPSDNPFGTAIYSYGHRNPQGITWDEGGNLWATEHGRSGLQSGYDELNLIQAGVNYGWPTIEGPEEKEGLTNPIINSGADQTWAPASALYWQGSIFFTGLRGESLYQYTLKTKEFEAHFYKDFGRLRALSLGPDNYFYLSTSNTDGRGEVKAGDDKIIRINPEIF